MRVPSVVRVAARAAVAVVAIAALAASSQNLVPRAQALTADADGQFHVVGTSIVGPDGEPFVPRGVNKAGFDFSPKGYDLGAWNFMRMKSWGVNFLRVPLNETYWLPSMCNYDPLYAARIDALVAQAESLQMLVLLDDHRSTAGLTCGAAGWDSAKKMADSFNVDFVTSLANRYKAHPYVAFDLYNEPHDITDDVWRNGGPVDSWTAVGMQQLLDAIRSTGAANLVFASGNNWANDLRMVASNPLANDTNVVYAVHSYPTQCGKTPVPWSQPFICFGKQYPSFLDTLVAPALATRAVAITEFGTKRSIPGEMSAPIGWFEDHHIGWAAYVWCNGTVANFCLLTADYTDTATVTGQPVRDALAPYRLVPLPPLPLP